MRSFGVPSPTWPTPQRRRYWGEDRARADLLLAWLDVWGGEHLPPLAEIAKSLRFSSQYEVWGALSSLEKRSLIRWRHGTRSENRGHQAVQIVSSGKVLKTAGCPFGDWE
jgi:hypothetical protein